MHLGLLVQGKPVSLTPTGMAAAITSKFSRCERKLAFSSTTAEVQRDMWAKSAVFSIQLAGFACTLMLYFHTSSQCSHQQRSVAQAGSSRPVFRVVSVSWPVFLISSLPQHVPGAGLTIHTSCVCPLTVGRNEVEQEKTKSGKRDVPKWKGCGPLHSW